MPTLVEEESSSSARAHGTARFASVAAAGAAALMVLALALPAQNLAQISKLTNLDLCNGKDRSSPDPQIRGRTSLIKSDKNPQVLAVAYNNRGVAYQKKGDLDLAMKDFEAAMSLEPNYPNTFANRGEIFFKGGDYTRAVKISIMR